MATYFGETVVRSTTARWIVEEYPFAPWKYELGVRKDSMTMMLYRFTDHFLVPNNKRRQIFSVTTASAFYSAYRLPGS